MGVGGGAPAACRNRPKLTAGSPESFESIRKRDEPAQALESWTTRATSGLNPILASLNERAVDFTFGELPEIRRQRRSLTKVPSRLPFRSATDKEWAHHVGGRDELQFNVAEDDGHLRWGVAISLQPSRSLRDITGMLAKMRKFSHALELHGSYLHNRGFAMWHWSEHTPFRGRSSDRPPSPVADDLYHPGAFVFVGKHAPPDSFDPDRVLRDFDTLLPIYSYVESDHCTESPALSVRGAFTFTPDAQTDLNQRSPTTLQVRAPGETAVCYAHHRMQDVLKRELVDEGAEVGTEHPDGNGRFIDLVARRDETLEFYEIKSGLSPRLCIREALGQLLEYAFWGDGVHPTSLIVVGDQPIDSEAQAYLGTLERRFQLPIRYRHVGIPVD